MVKPIPDDLIDPNTPDDVIIQPEARKPVTDPTVGISVNVNRQGTPRHRLVTIGDSLTHGFQSGAIFNTQLSYPLLIAKELGWDKQFRYPTYGGPGDGLPLNFEKVARQLEQRYGDKVDWWDFAPGLLALRDYLDNVEDYWERGEGSHFPINKKINHNLAVYGWDLRNTLSRNADHCLSVLAENRPKDDFIKQVVEYHNERAALRVLNSARDSQGKALSPLQAAAALSAEGTQETNSGDGIETLTVLIGSNNALGSVITFNVVWSDVGYDDMAVNDRYTVWRPIHFKAELDQLVAQIKKIRARHVILGTVPHVTIAPFARGISFKAEPGSQYFPHYTLPWISDKDFDPKKHPCITAAQALAIDSAIDQYNDYIVDAVRSARQEGRDWYVYETAGILDRLAARRYINDLRARPSWWDEIGGQYPLPPELKALSPVPDSRFFTADATGRKTGGLFSLDGIHPTTIGYGIMAQEFINIMQQAGVKFYQSDGKTERTGPIKIDFNRLIALDTLISKPPRSLSSDLSLIGWIDKNLNIFTDMLKRSY
jgi:hypothetical protein